MEAVKILGVGSNLPTQKVKSIDLFEEIGSERNYNVPYDWMIHNMGIIERRISQTNTLPSELAIPACEKAIMDSGLQPQEIEMVIFCGIERDRPEPATAHTIANKLGLNTKHSFDISNACFGFIEAIQVATSLIQSNQVNNALICTGEIPSRVLDAAVDRMKKGVSQKDFKKYIGALSVGDAGGAVVLSASDDNSGFQGFETSTWNKFVEKCYYNIDAFGLIDGQMEMGHMAALMIRKHTEMFDETMSKLKWSNFDFLLSHQIGEKPYQRLSKMSNIQNNAHHLKTFDKLGNITSATFPVNFEKIKKSDKFRQGDKMFGCFGGSGVVAGQFGYII